jgi:hypothetical protein
MARAFPLLDSDNQTQGSFVKIQIFLSQYILTFYVNVKVMFNYLYQLYYRE